MSAMIVQTLLNVCQASIVSAMIVKTSLNVCQSNTVCTADVCGCSITGSNANKMVLYNNILIVCYNTNDMHSIKF